VRLGVGLHGVGDEGELVTQAKTSRQLRRPHLGEQEPCVLTHNIYRTDKQTHRQRGGRTDSQAQRRQPAERTQRSMQATTRHVRTHTAAQATRKHARVRTNRKHAQAIVSLRGWLATSSPPTRATFGLGALA
jgi:hypothetical protein